MRSKVFISETILLIVNLLFVHKEFSRMLLRCQLLRDQIYYIMYFTYYMDYNSLYIIIIIYTTVMFVHTAYMLPIHLRVKSIEKFFRL